MEDLPSRKGDRSLAEDVGEPMSGRSFYILSFPKLVTVVRLWDRGKGL